MGGLIAWFAQNRVAANCLMGIILILGVTSLPATKKEILPAVEWDLFQVSVAFPQASATQIESQILEPLESALTGIDGVKGIFGHAIDGLGVVSLEVESFSDRGYEKISQRINSRLSNLTALPDGSEPPQLTQAQLKDLVGTLVVHGAANDRTLMNLAHQVKENLLSGGIVTHIETQNAKSREIRIEVDELALQRYGISFSQVVQSLKQRSLNLAAGEVSTSEGDAAIVTTTEMNTKAAIEDTFVTSFADGARVRVRDLAKVVDGFGDQSSYYGQFNGEAAVYLAVFRTGNQSIIDVAKALNDYQANPGVFLPEGIQLSVWQDVSKYFLSRVDLLLENAVTGLAILCAILLCFLSMRLSFWVALGIPVAFLGAFAVLLYTDNSINMISLFAFVLVLGIVVDDAIVVGENIFTHQSKGLTGVSGAITGAQEVSVPVLFAVLTTIVMFLPMLFLPGSEGKLIKAIPVVVISILIFSLIESLLILPAHLAGPARLPVNQGAEDQRAQRNPLARVSGAQQKLRNAFERFVELRFQPFLKHVLDWRYAYQALFLGLFVISIALFKGGWLKMAFFSNIEADYSSAVVHMPLGTALSETAQAVAQIEAAAVALKTTLAEDEDHTLGQIKNIVTFLGQGGGERGTHVGKVVIELEAGQARSLEGGELNRQWRDLTGHINNAVKLTFDASLNKPGPQINVKLLSDNPAVLTDAANALKNKLATYSGVYDIGIADQGLKQEIHIRPRPVAQDLGLNTDEIARQVRDAFAGVQINQFLDADSQVKVKVQYPKPSGSLWRLENMDIHLSTGVPVPLADVADIQYIQGPSELRRTNGRRAVQVIARVDERMTNTEEVSTDLKVDFLGQLSVEFPGVDWVPSGAQRAQMEFVSSLSYLYGVALVVMYGLMAVLFKSYFQPLMVMYAIPFGILGAVAGHLLMDLEVTLWSLVGVCAVTGVVVNDNLVLVDLINRKLSAGLSVKDAVIKATVARFRPIVLTTLTTFFGLVPLMAESSVQAKFLIPMCVSLGFGVLFATLVTLILVPATYVLLTDLRLRVNLPQREVHKPSNEVVNTSATNKPREPVLD